MKEAESIRQSANNAKNTADKLFNEANSLQARISNTESRFEKLEELANQDDILSETAKAKVGQAKTDTEEVQKKMKNALDNIEIIMGELKNMREISVQDLDELGNVKLFILLISH